jgi:hypothetical protein
MSNNINSLLTALNKYYSTISSNDNERTRFNYSFEFIKLSNTVSITISNISINNDKIKLIIEKAIIISKLVESIMSKIFMLQMTIKKKFTIF